MKKRETLSRGEELLAQVLEECLEEDLSFVPPEREIARKHRFTERFEASMKAFLAQISQNQKEQEIQKHFHPRYAHLAACVLMFCVCGWLFFKLAGPLGDKGMSTSDSAAADITESMEESAPAESPGAAPEAAESAAEAAEAESGQLAGTTAQEAKEYCMQTVYPAKQQDVPKNLEHVTTLVNCPVLDEDNPVLYLTIGNVGEETVKYLDQYELQVWLEDGWYVIPSENGNAGTWMELEAGMAVDEEINLSDYQMDFGAEQYRLIVQVDGEKVSAEFTFEEVFSEQMEKLEEEESSAE